VATLVRAFADIAQHLDEAGYSDADAAKLQKEVEFYCEIRSAIKKHSGEELDISRMKRICGTCSIPMYRQIPLPISAIWIHYPDRVNR